MTTRQRACEKMCPFLVESAPLQFGNPRATGTGVRDRRGNVLLRPSTPGGTRDALNERHLPGPSSSELVQEASDGRWGAVGHSSGRGNGLRFSGCCGSGSCARGKHRVGCVSSGQVQSAYCIGHRSSRVKCRYDRGWRVQGVCPPHMDLSLGSKFQDLRLLAG